MVKKGGKLPPGHINEWFWEDKDMKDYIATRLPQGRPPGPVTPLTCTTIPLHVHCHEYIALHIHDMHKQ